MRKKKDYDVPSAGVVLFEYRDLLTMSKEQDDFFNIDGLLLLPPNNDADKL